MQKSAWLSRPARLVWLFLQLTLVLAPLTAFLVWLERNGTLPWLPLQLGWPWIAGYTWPLEMRVAWDVLMMVALGYAATQFSSQVEGRCPPQTQRTIQWASWGIVAWALMGTWQPSGVTFWSFRIPLDLRLPVLGVSLAIFWFLVFGVMRPFQKNVLCHLGLAQIYASGPKAAQMNRARSPGWRASVRYRSMPLVGMALALFLTPVLSLDRLIAGIWLVYILRFNVNWEMKPGYDLPVSR